MAKEHSLFLEGQPYFNSSLKRTFQVFYTEPENGANEETGILLLISGFEGDTSSNVYIKMRNEFSDRENMVVIQCDYFGYQFMGPETMRAVHNLMSEMRTEVQARLEQDLSFLDEKFIQKQLALDETPDTFCELGIFQALDNLKAVKKVIELFSENQTSLCYDRIIAYGFSHGAYLALVCNALMPNLFSDIIDNSGWIYPVYLYRPRIWSEALFTEALDEPMTLFVMVEHKGRLWIDDLEIYNLRRLYSNLKNSANIISFHGENDKLVPLHEKENFLKRVNHTSLYVISEDVVDGNIFKNTKHGMGSNFLALFYYISEAGMLIKRIQTEADSHMLFSPGSDISTRKYRYHISSSLEISRILLK